MNKISIPDFGISWGELWNDIQTTGIDLLINIVTAIVIFIVGRMIARAITSGAHKLMQSQDTDKILESFLGNLVYWAMMTFVIIASISSLGIETTSLIAIMGAAGLAVGLALQGALANFAAGVLIVMFRPYRVGDYIEAAGIAGSVSHVDILTTILKTGDNKQIVVPNGQIMGGIITNYSTHDTRRVDMVFGVGYEDDIDKVRTTIEALVDADDRILKDPSCLIAVSELADSSVNFTVRPWVRTADYWGVMFDLTEAVKKGFDQAGISFPYPQQDVHLYQQRD